VHPAKKRRDLLVVYLVIRVLIHPAIHADTVIAPVAQLAKQALINRHLECLSAINAVGGPFRDGVLRSAQSATQGVFPTAVQLRALLAHQASSALQLDAPH
jgi:hypothetical protein